MDFWQERRRVGASLGLLRLPDKPEARGHIDIVNDPDAVWKYAAALMAQYEQNLQNQEVSRYRFRRIAVYDGLRRIPLCPSPQRKKTFRSVPREFRSLALRVSYGIHEIWFVLRFRLGTNGLDWRLDTTERLAPWVKIPLFLFGVAWLCGMAQIYLSYAAVAGYLVAGIILLWFLALFCGQATGGCLWGLLAWPFYLLTGGQKKREERTEENKPGVLAAWQQAQITVYDAFHAPQRGSASIAVRPPLMQSDKPSTPASPATQTTFQPKRRG